MPPIVTLTSDFGLGDPFVGIMKGVILSICPEARLVDLTHEIAPQDVLGGQLALESSVPYFPPGTVHLAVVDPGVGTARRALAVHARGQWLVGPDNGLLTFAFAGPGWSAVEITAERYRLPLVSQTFHGRDVFAPAAAHLARGARPEHLGPPVPDPVRWPIPEARLDGHTLVGEVIAADRFGNLITSLTEEALGRLEGGGPIEIELQGCRLGAPRSAYADVRVGEPGAVIGSQGRLEIFVREGSARAILGAVRGAPVSALRR